MCRSSAIEEEFQWKSWCDGVGYYYLSVTCDGVLRIYHLLVIIRMCLGGHLALRCAFDNRVSAAVCYFPTDIHSSSLGKGKNDNSISVMTTIKGEVVLIFGKKDNHVSPEGRDLIRKKLHDAGVDFTFLEISGAAHAFIRDESSKGRYDAATTKYCFELLLELFNRRLKLDLGEYVASNEKPKDVC